MGATYDTRSRRNEANATSCTGVRYPLRTNTPSTTLESRSDQDGARSAARARAKRRSEVGIWSDVPQRGEAPAPRSTSRRKLSRSGATIGSEVRNPRAKRRNEADIWSDVPQRGEAPALEAERPDLPARVSLLLIENLCFIWAFQVVD
ncbi:hypothetical protein DY000_02052677 [Brassica cretica]|uniref:Uncharacterized protein n=1 Tax=Brassica cretica TaxID=69181 RepID=A0ABQ7A9K0_BRACR|nr:hypothetical protein DY000_02052677 [Brassica cretica]